MLTDSYVLAESVVLRPPPADWENLAGLADTDGDGIPDALEYGSWSRSGTSIVANPDGFNKPPLVRDTDRGDVLDRDDSMSVGGAFAVVTIVSPKVYGTDEDSAHGSLVSLSN